MRAVLSPNPYRDRDLRACLTARRILTSSGVEVAISLPFALDEGSKLEIPQEADLQPSEEVLPGRCADLLRGRRYYSPCGEGCPEVERPRAGGEPRQHRLYGGAGAG